MSLVPSQIVAVQVYRRGATVVRHAVVDVDAAGLPAEIEVAGLPLSLLDPTVKVRVLESSSVTAASVRIGLHVRGGGERPVAPDQKEVDDVAAALRAKQELVRLIDNEIGLVQSIPVPDRPQADEQRAPPPAPLSMRLALESFADEAAQRRRAERRALGHEMHDLEERLARLEERIASSSSAAEVHLADVSKSAVIELRAHEPSAQRVVVELSYLVPGARWTPAYQVKLARDGSKAAIQLRAHVAQKSGEDWSGVKLKLSTAAPLRFTELPELSSVRIGKQQPAPTPRGFRPAPVGGEVLFRDFDRDRARVQAAVPPPAPWDRPALDDAGHDLVNSTRSLPQPKPQPKPKTRPTTTKKPPPPGRPSRLGELLVRENLMSLQQLQHAQREQGAKGGKLGAHVTRLGYVDARTLVNFLARQYGVRVINLAEFEIDISVIRLVPKELAEKHRIIPVSRAGATLIIAMADPSNIFAIDDVKFFTGYNIEATVCLESSIDLAIQKYYSGPPTGDMMNSALELDELGADVSFDEDVDSALQDDETDHAEVFEEEEAQEPRAPSKKGKAWDLDLEVAERSDRRSSGEKTMMFEAPVSEKKPSVKGARPRGSADDDAVGQSMLFPLLHLPAGSDPARGKLVPVDVRGSYERSLSRFGRPVPFDAFDAVAAAAADAALAGASPPPLTIDIAGLHSVYDFAYEADGVVDVAGDGGFHSVALGEREGEASMRYVAVPREEPAVYRTAIIQNPLASPLLSGPAEVYVDGDYVLTTVLPTVALRGEVKLGLGVEQAIKIARNARFAESRSDGGVVAMVELVHDVDIDIVNHLGRAIDIEVRDRVPVASPGAEVQVDERVISPPWEPWHQEDSGVVVAGGRRWVLQVAPGATSRLHARYVLKLFSNAEVVGGNRRES
ncbi:MAG: DUF4139 domain-containing protein [Deltaproteobacteria bacterium]|nr:DUF4139 domain-containing protein [Deltaproteobacteria bacterium]